MQPKVDSGDTAWLLVSCALVLLMTPGLALFYGGMVQRKNVLSILMYVLVALPIVTVEWTLFGYSMVFGASHGGLIGGLDHVGLMGLASGVRGSVPTLAFVAFQMMFAIITPALIAGAFAERMKFSVYVAFVFLWSVLVYNPVAHWVWADDGWLLKKGALDFAGGTVVHAVAGLSALVGAFALGPRLGYPHHRAIPHNLTMTISGAGLLWFGWFGFNAGSALTSGSLASLALVTTHVAAGAGALSWMVVEWVHRKKATAFGVVSGLVAGLVAITPAAGFVSPVSAVIMGLMVSPLCYLALMVKERAGYDDALDAFGIHGVGGIFGALATGVFADKRLNPAGADGLLHGGGVAQLGIQALGVVACGAYAAIVTFVLLKVLGLVFGGLRVSEVDEREGLDVSQHGEQGYAQ
jgi:Amt family ammonium transporter